MEKEQRENNDKYLDDNWNRVKTTRETLAYLFKTASSWHICKETVLLSDAILGKDSFQTLYFGS